MQMPNPYGPTITLEIAKTVARATAESARKQGMQAAIAVVGPGGDLIYFERFDTVQFGSTEVARHKAVCAARFKRPTKEFEDMVVEGKIHFLTLDGVCAIEGGVPLVADGLVIGAVGVSGGTAAQDGQAARAGAAVLA